MSVYPPLPEEKSPVRAPYDARYFVGRKKEVRGFRRKIEEGQAGYPMTRPVIHIWGAPGIGKSWLLRHICRRSSEMASHVSEPRKRRGALCALVDFSKLQFAAQEPSTVIELLEQLDQGLRSQMGGEHLASLAKRFGDEVQTVRESLGDYEATQLVTHFVEYLSELSEHFVVLLLFDGVENLSPDDFFWIEQHLFEPLALTDRIMIVVSGRREIPRWKRFSVRRRLERWEIRPFEPSTTREQLSSLGVPHEWAADVYAHTFGHPYANQVWGAALAGGEPQTVLASRSNLLLGQIEGELLRGVTSKTERDILRTLSALRKFNIESARNLLTEILGGDYEAMSDGDYLRLFERLEKTNLVYWHSERRAYVMDSSVRRIIDLRIQYGSLDIFRERHEAAQRLYEVWFRESSKDRGALLLEILYHLSRKMAVSPVPDVGGYLEASLGEYLDRDLEADDIDMLWRQLMADQEFQGLGSVVPGEVFEELQAEIGQRRDEMIAKNSGAQL